MYDGSAVAAAELRFREDLWRTAPSDAVQEAEVRMQRFGPVLATVFADLPNVTLVNMVLGAAEQNAVDGGHLSAAIEWLRSREVDYRVSVSDDRPGTAAAESWLASRGYVPGSAMRRYLRPATTRVAEGPNRVMIRELGALETVHLSDQGPGGVKPPRGRAAQDARPRTRHGWLHRRDKHGARSSTWCPSRSSRGSCSRGATRRG